MSSERILLGLPHHSRDYSHPNQEISRSIPNTLVRKAIHFGRLQPNRYGERTCQWRHARRSHVHQDIPLDPGHLESAHLRTNVIPIG